MSVRIGTATIQVENYLELEEARTSLEEKLKFHGNKHPDFSCIIEQNTDLNQIIIKTLYLGEYAN